ncbi:MAG: potassium-transporting ATPase subunit KdpB [bacterium]|nr:potassium-transporting ATPase subunit KdpB [bacterium]
MTTQNKKTNLFDPQIVRRAISDSFRKLDPRIQVKNPVMLVVFICAIILTIVVIVEIAGSQYSDFKFNIQIMLWLWFTVLFANFAEAIAEGRGKAQADTLRAMRKDTVARRIRNGQEEKVSASDLAIGDLVLCEAGDIIPGDGDVVEGIASVDESAITGESAPVIRESGGDRSAVTGGTRVISDRITIGITATPGQSFLDRMISMVEGAKRQQTPNERALSVLLLSLTAIFLLAVGTLKGFTTYSENASGNQSFASLTVLISLVVCLIPTTIGGLLSAIGISGMDRMLRKNVLAMSGKAVEAAGDIDVMLLDKTGTITLGNRMATSLIPVWGTSIDRLADAAQLASLPDETPEGRSIVVLAKDKYGLRGRDLPSQTRFIPFSARTRISGVDLPGRDGTMRTIRKGAIESIWNHVRSNGGLFPLELNVTAHDVARSGATPLAVAEGSEVLGLIVLKDVVKGGIRERFAELRRMGIKTIMITGDNPLTAASIAAEAGVDDFIAEATPETKLQRIRDEQSEGHLVAMIGDGTNDAPALAQSDVGVAMNTGTQAAREAGNMVDLDSNPTKLIEVVETGKQLLMTRGALTTFSIANDVSKYFAILPAMFSGLYASAGGQLGPLAALNVMGLHSPQSAVLSAVIFNALIIVALIPLALKGVKYRPLGASVILSRNLALFGLGGLIIPFVGIKLIDLLLVNFKLI